MNARPDAIAHRLPVGWEFVRFIAVGAWNTAFGYGTYAGFTWLLTGLIPYPYLVAAVLSNAVAISVAFLLYKFFVFRTRGNALAEYLKVNVVYLAVAGAGLLLLPLMVHLAARLVGEAAAPYLGQAFLVPLAAVASYVAHRRFSFARRGGGTP